MVSWLKEVFGFVTLSDLECKQEEEIDTILQGRSEVYLSGTVDYVHHIGSENGEEMVFLREYDELPIYVSSAAFSALKITEGGAFSHPVKKLDGSIVGVKGPILWLIEEGHI